MTKPHLFHQTNLLEAESASEIAMTKDQRGARTQAARWARTQAARGASKKATVRRVMTKRAPPMKNTLQEGGVQLQRLLRVTKLQQKLTPTDPFEFEAKRN